MAKYEIPTADPLAQTWKRRISDARKHWEKFHKRVAHNRKTVAGFDWQSDPATSSFYKLRANLIQGTITATLPQVYARNPEISVSPNYNAEQLKLFCSTLEKVTNVSLERAHLKGRAKATVRAALTCSFGIVKVMYQRDIQDDPAIIRRIEDAQDNIAHADRLLAEIQDESQRGDIDARKAELQQTIEGLKAQTEIVMGEGLVVDRLLTEHLLIDPAVTEFWDYAEAGWMAQIIPMRKAQAEAAYKVNLDKATPYKADISTQSRGGLASADTTAADDDAQVSIIEIWDKASQRVYTMCDGCDYWVREPYSPPRAGQRWYPYFLLPFQTVDGQFIAPSLVDLTEKLQDEHNDAREKFNKHRDLIKPGWIAGGTVDEKSIKRYADSEIGEITIVDMQGAGKLEDFIRPRQHPPIDPSAYDTSAVRYDWEQVTGMQDAARSSVVSPKTATEADIMQQALTGRVEEFRDQVEDWLQEIAQYAAQILIFELGPEQVEKIMGPHQAGQMTDPVTGQDIEIPGERAYDWPQLTRDEVFEMISLKIRAGTTGAPDKAQQRESWAEILPIIQGLITQIMEVQANGLDATPIVNLLKETINRFDDRLVIEDFLPEPPQMQQMQQQQMPVDPNQPQGDPNANAIA